MLEIFQYLIYTTFDFDEMYYDISFFLLTVIKYHNISFQNTSCFELLDKIEIHAKVCNCFKMFNFTELLTDAIIANMISEYKKATYIVCENETITLKLHKFRMMGKNLFKFEIFLNDDHYGTYTYYTDTYKLYNIKGWSGLVIPKSDVDFLRKELEKYC